MRAPLPRAWRAGLALEEVPLVRARWTALAEVTGRRDGAARPRAGLEGAWSLGAVALAARAGWTAGASDDLARPLTLGAGVRRGRIWLDYAWRDWAELGATHRVGLRWQR